MKKYLSLFTIFAILISAATCICTAEYTKYSSKFMKKFRDCEAYEETLNSEFEGKTFTTHRQIIGWRNGLCRYQVTISSPSEGKYNLKCSFSSLQVDELYEAMRDRSKKTISLDIDIFKKNAVTKSGDPAYTRIGSTLIKGPKGYITWTKYENNPYFCVPERL